MEDYDCSKIYLSGVTGAQYDLSLICKEAFYLQMEKPAGATVELKLKANSVVCKQGELTAGCITVPGMK